MADTRRGDQPERSFGWFEPKRRRATLYEDVTVDSQPSITRHLDRGWPVCFEDGRGTWSEDSTELRSSDWYAFRDPGQLWERTYYHQGTAYERLIEVRCAPPAGSACSTTSTPSGSSSYAVTSRCRPSSSTASGWRWRARRATASPTPWPTAWPSRPR